MDGDPPRPPSAGCLSMLCLLFGPCAWCVIRMVCAWVRRQPWFSLSSQSSESFCCLQNTVRFLAIARN